jgi:hypothetical protein
VLAVPHRQDNMKNIEEGTRGVALDPKRGKVPVVFEHRDLTLDSGVVVTNVLAGVAEDTGEVLTIPAQSTPRIELARQSAKDAGLVEQTELVRDIRDARAEMARGEGIAHEDIAAELRSRLER